MYYINGKEYPILKILIGTTYTTINLPIPNDYNEEAIYYKKESETLDYQPHVKYDGFHIIFNISFENFFGKITAFDLQTILKNLNSTSIILTPNSDILGRYFEVKPMIDSYTLKRLASGFGNSGIILKFKTKQLQSVSAVKFFNPDDLDVAFSHNQLLTI